MKLQIYDAETNTLVFQRKFVQIRYLQVGFFRSLSHKVNIVITVKKKETDIQADLLRLKSEQSIKLPINISSCLNYVQYILQFSSC